MKERNTNTVEPLLRGHPDKRPTPLERSQVSFNLHMKVLILTPDERPPLLKGHNYVAKVVASQERFQVVEIKILDGRRQKNISSDDMLKFVSVSPIWYSRPLTGISSSVAITRVTFVPTGSCSETSAEYWPLENFGANSLRFIVIVTRACTFKFGLKLS